MHIPNSASPEHVEFRKRTPLFRSTLWVSAACFLIFSFLASEAFGTRENTSQPAASSCAVNKPAAAKSKPTVSGKAAAKSKRPTQAKRKAKAPARPVVSKKTKAKAENITSEISWALPENLETEISKFFGLRYQFGGHGPGGIDCSALVQRVYSDVFGVDLPRSSSQQSRVVGLEKVPEDELKTGDLLFFGPRRKRVNHVGLYLASGYFLHAARSEGVTISRLDNDYWKSRWMFSKRMNGLETAYALNEDQTLERTLDQYSANFAFGGDGSARKVSFVESGIEVGDSLEFLLSGFLVDRLEDPSQPLGVESSTWLQTAETAQTQTGFRFATILSPSEWFKLVPSVVQTQNSEEENMGGRDRQELGLETRMILPSSGLALFMAAHAKNQQDLFERPLAVSPDWETLDMAFGLHYSLSDSLRFSLWGSRAYNNTDLSANEELEESNAPLDDVSFQLNIKF